MFLILNMELSEIIFYLFASLIVAAATAILFTSNLLHAAFFLMIALLGISAVFVLAGADFLAITQIMIYIGGILVLILFGIMMTRNDQVSSSPNNKIKVPLFALFIAGTILSFLLLFIAKMNYSSKEWILTAIKEKNLVKVSTVKPLGILMMTEYLIPFELAGLILLIALIGSAYIAFKTKFND